MTVTTSNGAGLGIALDRAAGVPLYRQIADSIRRQVQQGELAAGSQLPPERRLAGSLGVDRSTVIAAYRELAADGLVEAHVGRGTTISQPKTADWHGLRPIQRLDWQQLLAPAVAADPLLDELGALAERSDVVSFVSGIPAPEFYPIAEFRSLLDEALGAGGEGLLQYCPPEGFAPLRTAIAGRMTHQGTTVSPHRVLICAGSQQGLYLLARALLEPGDTVVVEAPTYHGALLVFRSVGARVVAVPVDRHGLDIDRLNDLLGRRPVKLIYTLPTFQNPTGVTLSLERRQRLLETARRHGVPIVEDDPYGELGYEESRLPSLLALDRTPGGSVIYLSTFSKILFPGFRLGWIVAPEPVIARLAWVKGLVDLDSNPLAQWAVGEYLRRGRLDPHLDRLRAIYPERRDRLVSALAEGVGSRLTWQRPAGGFYLWARLAGAIRAREVLTEAIALGVAFVPGDLYHADGGGRDTMRLAFSALAPDQLALGAERLSRAIMTVSDRRTRNRESAPRPPTRIV
ncbi:MAG: PLP-dependent aminotransferase family protein [Chloroflexia bacterium]|nr:PLP-dependent aminotransferase family protein [Chloroflexia bacterium]